MYLKRNIGLVFDVRFLLRVLDAEPLGCIVRDVVRLQSQEVFIYTLSKHWPGMLSYYQDPYIYFKMEQQLEALCDRCATILPKGKERNSPQELESKVKSGSQTKSKISRSECGFAGSWMQKA